MKFFTDLHSFCLRDLHYTEYRQIISIIYLLFKYLYIETVHIKYFDEIILQKITL